MTGGNVAVIDIGKTNAKLALVRLSDLSEIAVYAKVDNQSYRMIRSMTPGPYTFILPATKQVPKRLQHPRRRTVGIRVPTHPITRALIEGLGEPLLSTTMQLPGDEVPLTEGFEIFERVGYEVDLVIDGGACGMQPTSVIDLVGPYRARRAQIGRAGWALPGGYPPRYGQVGSSAGALTGEACV